MFSNLITSFSLADLLAVFIFIFAWVVYVIITDYTTFYKKTIEKKIIKDQILWIYRIRQDKEATARTAYFLKTSFKGIYTLMSLLLGIIGTLIAEIVNLFIKHGHSEIFYITQNTVQVLQFKIISSIILCIYCFFIFLKAINYFSLQSITVCSLNHSNKMSKKYKIKQNKQLLRIHRYTFSLYNRGWRTLFFIFAYFIWIVSPYLLILATIIVTIINIYREYFSTIAYVLNKYPQATKMNTKAFLWK